MISAIKVIFAIILLIPFFIFGYSYHLYKEIKDKHNFSMGEYNETVAYQLDILGCALIYNVRSYTLSAMAHEKSHWWFEYLINLLFWDKNHCKDQYDKEFKNKQ